MKCWVRARGDSVPGSLRRAFLATALGSAATVAPAEAAAVRPSPCAHVVASPGFAVDGTAFCAGSELGTTGFGLLVTTDRGRSWRKAAARGLPYKSGDVIDDLAVSPLFSEDRTVFMSVRFEGVFQSTDLGEAFTPVIPAATPSVTPFVAGTGSLGIHLPVARTMLLVARSYGDKPAVVDPLTRVTQPVLGAPEPAVGAVVSPSWSRDRTAVLFTQSGGGRDARVTAYGCSATFDCGTRLGAFPAGVVFGQAWAAADFAVSRTLFVRATDAVTGVPRLFVSRDAGGTFTALGAAQARVSPHTPRPGRDMPAVVTLAPGAPGTDRVWMRVYGAPADSPVPALELFRSDDNGRSWTRVAFGRIGQRGPRGTMTDLRIAVGSAQPRSLLAATADGHVFLNGIASGGWTAHCSSDGGRTWGTFCRS